MGDPNPNPASAEHGGTTAQLLQLPENRGNEKPYPPHHLEVRASVIGVGTMGETRKGSSGDFTQLQIDRVILGTVKDASIITPDELPFFGCIAPEEPTTASSLFKPGTQVLVYLTEDQQGFRLLDLQRLLPSGVDPWVLRFAEITNARRRRAPAAEFRQLLFDEQWDTDSPAVVALGGWVGGWERYGEQEPNAYEAVLEQLRQCKRGADESWADLANRLARMLSVLPDGKRHHGITPAFACFAGAPAAHVKGPRPASCEDCPGGDDPCVYECSDYGSMLDRTVPACVKDATPSERKLLEDYAARRGSVGIAIDLESARQYLK